jgi:hypothetical protein
MTAGKSQELWKRLSRTLHAILGGERDPLKLASLRDYRIKATEETVAKSLVGDYRPEHLFTLRQSPDAWRYHRKLIAECDDEVQRHLVQFASKADPKQKPLPRPRKVSSSKVYSSCPDYDLRTEHYRILGVDLTEVPGINTLLVHTLLAEVGPDLSKFRSAARLLPGWACVPTTASAAARYCPCAPATCRTAPHWRCASPPTHCITTSLFLAITTAVCGLNSVLQKPLPPQRISWHAFSTICSLLASPIRRASSLSGKLNINKELSSVFTPGHEPLGTNSSPRPQLLHQFLRRRSPSHSSRLDSAQFSGLTPQKRPWRL